ncbi:hypothetical protein Pflav_054450 [Phytohabitans flavus]|uniref:Pyruvate dehydrogenase E1 component middle domain-containing protein n=1 Tax=Phytohabitans flavus TaxID=1076124 RepID=A0A6F8XYY7_9ACTN|nr:hypothetical protein Pflav_054450 [Phytohabitans flavus]
MATERKRPVISDGLPSQLLDIDPEETREWIESLDAVIDERGAKRARYVMLSLLERARERQVGVPPLTTTDYINTIPPEQEPWFPGDEFVERRIRHTSGGTPRCSCTAPSDPRSASAGTSRRTRVPPRCTRWA